MRDFFPCALEKSIPFMGNYMNSVQLTVICESPIDLPRYNYLQRLG